MDDYGGKGRVARTEKAIESLTSQRGSSVFGEVLPRQGGTLFFANRRRYRQRNHAYLPGKVRFKEPGAGP